MAGRVSAGSSPRNASSPDKSATGLPASRVQSVDRAVLLLRAVAEAGAEGATTAALGQSCDINRATAWRILTTLATHGLVDHRGLGHWVLGPGLLDLARSAGSEVLLRDGRRLLEWVATQSGETAALAVLRESRLTYVEEVIPDSVVAVTWNERTVSPHATSTGKVALAWSTESERQRLLPPRLPRYTTTTITDHEELRAELDRVRERGYATCCGEYDTSAWGVSAPVLDRAGRLLAVLSIWGPPPRVSSERFAALGEIAIEAATRMAPA